MNAAQVQGLAIGAAVLAGLYLAKKLTDKAAAGAAQAVEGVKGLLTGDNPVTQGATNAAGEPTKAYIGVPVVGTLGAATNALSGGYLATAGEYAGNAAWELQNWIRQPFLTEPPAINEVSNQSAAETARLQRQDRVLENAKPWAAPPMYEVSPDGYQWGQWFGWGSA